MFSPLKLPLAYGTITRGTFLDHPDEGIHNIAAT